MTEPFYYDDDDDGYDSIPWADPAIRANYEAALGRLILAHNDIDLHLTKLIECVLGELGNPPELEKLKLGLFDRRLDNLRMLNAISTACRLRGFRFEELTELNRLRNIVAHGHFEQNPYEGDYELITAKKSHSDFSTERLDEITERMKKAASLLRAQVTFWSVIIDLPPGAVPVNPDDPRLVKRPQE